MRMLEIHLEVSDIERSLKLYSQLIPHSEIRKWADGAAVALVLEDGSAFGLWSKGQLGIHNGQGGNHVHFAFEIKPEEFSYYKKLIQDVGLEPLEYEWPMGHKSIYFFDYDQHQGEFMAANWFEVE